MASLHPKAICSLSPLQSSALLNPASSDKAFDQGAYPHCLF